MDLGDTWARKGESKGRNEESGIAEVKVGASKGEAKPGKGIISFRKSC